MDLSKPYFSGIGGAGMSALAQYLALEGRSVSGSDRSFDQLGVLPVRTVLEKLGVQIHPQDGTGLTTGHSCLVLSSAIENDNPEVKRAGELGLDICHRSELLRELTLEKKTIAVAGTSGKSTVTAMIFEILELARMNPSLLSGAGLVSLKEKGLWGNAYAGSGDWLVFEADESDGTLVQYRPEIGLLLNIDKDHKELEDLYPIFQTYIQNVRESMVFNAEDPHVSRLNFKPVSAAFSSFANVVLTIGEKKIPVVPGELGDWSVTFSVGGVPFKLPLPGRHNFYNALAAITAALSLNIPLDVCTEALENYRGIDRRMNLIGKDNGIAVVDDFAHNPVKIRASMEAIKNWINRAPEYKRLVAIFHPHGFTPLKLMKEGLIKMFPRVLGDEDILILSEAYYAGGTAEQSPSSRDVAEALLAAEKNVYFVAKRTDIPPLLTQILRPGDVILNMGARDPKLSGMAVEYLKLAGELVFSEG